MQCNAAQYNTMHFNTIQHNATQCNTKCVHFSSFQGMGYLHARNIVHKDLTSRNVLLDEQLSDKVVITDVGFNSVTDGQAFMG